MGGKIFHRKINQLSQLILISKSYIYSAIHFKECIYFLLSVLDLKFMVQSSSSNTCKLDVYLFSCS